MISTADRCLPTMTEPTSTFPSHQRLERRLHRTRLPHGHRDYYDASPEHADWGAVSEVLANNVNTGIMDTIVAHADSTWVCRGACVTKLQRGVRRDPHSRPCGDSGRTGLSTTRAIVTRTACTWRELFCSARRPCGASTKAFAATSHVNRTWDFYFRRIRQRHYPFRDNRRREYDVSITFRNRGVLGPPPGVSVLARSMTAIRSLRSVASPDSGVGGRQGIHVHVHDDGPHDRRACTRPIGRMLREGVIWFGDTVSRVIDVKPPWTPGDHDHDGDVDQIDFGHLQPATAGRRSSEQRSVRVGQADGDSDVDQNDFAVFLECMQGPDVQVGYTCAD